VEQWLKSYKENKNVKGGGNQYREWKNEYIYYENFWRSPIYTKYVKVLKWQIEISWLDEKKILKKWEIAILYANIKHTIKWLEDVNKYVYFIEEFLEKPDDFH
jgi:hypothetical protein